MDKNIGKIFGPYTIIDVSENRSNDDHKLYIAKCTCGKLRECRITQLERLVNTECQHYSRFGDVSCERAHFTNKRISKIFYDIMRRCYDKNDKCYNIYGAKNIQVYNKWIKNPEEFEKWAYSNGYKDNLTIDRINESKGYNPDNCRWVTMEENARFKSTTNYITANVTLSGKQWASLIPSVSINAINRMVKRDGMEKTVEFIEDKLCNKHDIHNRRKQKHAKFYYMHGKFYEDPTQ